MHAKLTGAGGGGCVICFPKEPDFDGTKMFADFEKKGYKVYQDIQESKEGLIYEII